MWVILAVLGCKHAAPVGPAPVPAPAVAASPAEGSWTGELALPGGAGLRVVFHVRAEGEGLAATLDSPDQGAFGIPAQQATFADGELVVEIPAILGGFRGRLVGDRLDGTWTQGGGSMPLVLERASDADLARPARPQDPVPPFPYAVEEVVVPSVQGVALAGTYTRPEGDGPFPGVVLITGSGPQDRDEALMGHRPFAVLADHLTRAGVAVLRVDDRGFGKSTGDFKSATTTDFALDAAHALAWLDARPETGDVGYVGHSEGGLVGPYAQWKNAGIARADFLVLLAGPSVSGLEVVVEQGALIQAADGADPAAIESDRATSRAAFDAIVAGGEGMRERALTALRASPDFAALPQEGQEAMLEEITSPWFRWFLAYDPKPALRAMDVPVLALFGEKDLQVPPEQSAAGMREALGARGTVEVMPGLNHLFQPAKTGSPSEYATIPITFDPAALERVSAFVLGPR